MHHKGEWSLNQWTDEALSQCVTHHRTNAPKIVCISIVSVYERLAQNSTVSEQHCQWMDLGEQRDMAWKGNIATNTATDGFGNIWIRSLHGTFVYSATKPNGSPKTASRGLWTICSTCSTYIAVRSWHCKAQFCIMRLSEKCTESRIRRLAMRGSAEKQPKILGSKQQQALSVRALINRRHSLSPLCPQSWD